MKSELVKSGHDDALHPVCQLFFFPSGGLGVDLNAQRILV